MNTTNPLMKKIKYLFKNPNKRNLYYLKIFLYFQNILNKKTHKPDSF